VVSHLLSLKVRIHLYFKKPVGHSSVLGTAMKIKRREEEGKKRREDEKSGLRQTLTVEKDI
jgi:hypothetical protein